MANSVNFQGTFSVLLGNGDGTFQTAQSYPADIFASSIAIGDFNGDGKPDLAMVNMIASNSVSVLLGNGDGTFGTAQTFGAEFTPDSVAVGDLNADGKAGPGRDKPRQRFGQRAAGQRRRHLPAHPGLWHRVRTLQRDGGRLERRRQARPGRGQLPTRSTCCWATATAPSRPQRTSTRASPAAVAVADFNGDGKPDLAVPNVLSNSYSVLMSQFTTTTAVSAPASATYGQPVVYTATVMSGASPMTAGTVTFEADGTPLGAAIPVDSSGQAAFGFATLSAGSHTITAVYSGAPAGAGTTGFGISVGNTSLVINPIPLSATGVNVSANVDEPFTGIVATFTNPDPVGTAGSYFAAISWGDGNSTLGSISGSGTLLTVTGTNTYVHPGTHEISVQIGHVLGNTTTATTSATATVFSLVRNVGFWHKKHGQALINSFNGGAKSTALSSWLATSFPNLYGAVPVPTT